MNCKEIEEREILDGYLLNRLTEADREEYERHFFDCGVCLSKVQVGLALQQELRNAPKPDFAAICLFGRWKWAATFPAVTLSVILVLGSWWYSTREHHRAVSTLSPGPSPPRSQFRAPLAPSLNELARVTPPPYSAAVLRSTESQAQTEFSKAMKNYQRGDYEHSIPGLRRAAQMDPATAQFRFYLGVCYLLTNQTDAAIDSFKRTISFGDAPYAEGEPPYADEAHFYLAKAYLMQGRIAEAKSELLAVRSRDEHVAEAEDIVRQLPK